MNARNIVIYATITCLLLLFLGVVTGRHFLVREHTLFSLPDGIHQIDHSRIRTHLMTAEYSRNVTFITNGKHVRTTQMAKDTCGGYPINCYYIDASAGGQFLRMDDAVSEHLLDLKTSKTYVIIRAQGTAFLGELTDEHISASWSSTDKNPAPLSVMINDRPAVPMASLTHNGSEHYIGRLDGHRFIPASDSPALPIDHPGE